MDYSKILYTDNMIFPNTFKVIVNSDNFESVQRLLFMAGMRWTFSGQDVIPYNTNVEFSFLHIGRNSHGVIQMFHLRDLFDSLNIPELIMSNI